MAKHDKAWESTINNASELYARIAALEAENGKLQKQILTIETDTTLVCLEKEDKTWNAAIEAAANWLRDQAGPRVDCYEAAHEIGKLKK